MKISDNDKKLMLYLGGGVAAYFLLIKPLLQKLGIVKSKDEVEEEKKQDTSQTNYVNNASGRLTKSESEWQIIANTIYEDLRFSSLDDNKADAGYQVSRVQTEKDLATLIKAFGFKQEYFFGLPTGGKKDLPAFIRTNLSKSAIEQINWNYRSKKIKFQY